MINLDAERASIGGVMLSGEVSDFSGLSPSDFYDPRHGLICEAIYTLSDQSKPFDPITICDLLHSRESLINAGGSEYVNYVMLETPSKSNVEAYSEIVADMSKKRQLADWIGTAGDNIGTEKSFDEILSNFQQDLSGMETAKNKSASMFETCKEFIEYLDRQENELKTGYWDLYTGGIEPGLHVIAAGTGQGKSTLALNIASNIANTKYGVGYYSYEMPRMKLMERLVSRRSRVPMEKIRDRSLGGDDWQAVTKAMSAIKDQKFYIHDQVFKIDQLCSSIRRGFSKGFIDVAFVDYLQLVPADAKSREQEVAKIARSLQQVAMASKKPIFALSQLSRAHESRTNPKPRNADLRESGEIEHSAETIIFIYDEERYIENSQRTGLVEIYAGKNRNGELFSVFAKKRLDINYLELYTGPIAEPMKKPTYKVER